MRAIICLPQCVALRLFRIHTLLYAQSGTRACTISLLCLRVPLRLCSSCELVSTAQRRRTLLVSVRVAQFETRRHIRICRDAQHSLDDRPEESRMGLEFDLLFILHDLEHIDPRNYLFSRLSSKNVVCWTDAYFDMVNDLQRTRLHAGVHSHNVNAG